MRKTGRKREMHNQNITSRFRAGGDLSEDIVVPPAEMCSTCCKGRPRQLMDLERAGARGNPPRGSLVSALFQHKQMRHLSIPGKGSAAGTVLSTANREIGLQTPAPRRCTDIWSLLPRRLHFNFLINARVCVCVSRDAPGVGIARWLWLLPADRKVAGSNFPTELYIGLDNSIC